MGVVLTVFIVLLVIVFLVVVHELGHFTAARLAGVKCPEFFVGFGPRIWSTKRGDTEFGIKWILVGGYVKVLGMNPEEEISPEDFPHSYKGVSYWRRFWIIFSGSLTHILLAVIIMFFTIWFIGYPDTSRGTNTLASVGQYMDEDQREETPAYIAGLEEGDTVLALDGHEITSWDEISDFIKEHPGEEVTILVEREEQEIELTARLATLESGSGYLGVSPEVYMEDYSFTGSIVQTGKWFGQASWGVFYGVYRVFNLSTFKQLIGISEPTAERPQTVVGITRTASQIAGEGLFYFLNFFAFICLFLAYINLAPLPPLDGGHVVVLLWEKITGREVDMRKLYPVAVAVLAFFLILFVLTLRLDITNPINLP
ncbi:MAG: site-2 protease family protein [Actinomycetota bacterium]|nr:site-2 protease family protein [Actinomycetota bacterium]